MSAKAQALALQGWNGRLRYQHEIATLTLQRTGSTLGNGNTSPFSDITDKWEIAVDQEKPELFENETFILAATYLDTDYSCNIGEQIFQCVRATASSSHANYADFWANANAQLIKKNDGTDLEVGGEKKSVAIFLAAINAGVPAYYTYIRQFVSDYLRGQTNFLRGKYILKHTTNAPSTYGSNVADWNVERIYTIAQLLSEAQSTSYWIMPLPGYLVYKILNYTVPTYMQENRQWGALKTRSGAVTAARGRVEITTEYIIDAWPKHTYALAS